MAIVQGIREKVHLPIYDSLKVETRKQLRDAESTATLKFFVDVQRKTKLETNLQSASLLPHYNTFEARAMRVVISDLPPVFPDDVEVVIPGTPVVIPGTPAPNPISKPLTTDLARAMELLELARADAAGETVVAVDGQGKEPPVGSAGISELTLVSADIEAEILALKESPPKEQVRPNNGSGTIIGKLIYNTVTTLYVGEKIMIQMPTWFFPAGAGPYSESAGGTTHGEPSPTATFRFAEPIFIDKQQNFRVEIEIPDTDTLKEIQKIYGPMNVWVVLDGYMTRDVQ
jgi:hypothetical protein